MTQKFANEGTREACIWIMKIISIEAVTREHRQAMLKTHAMYKIPMTKAHSS